MLFFKSNKRWKTFNRGFLIGFGLVLCLLKTSISFAQSDSQTSVFKQVNVSFPNAEVNLNGNLFLPVSGDNFPAVVIIHGSGPNEGLEYKVYAEEFAKAGIAALVYDKRGSGKSGGDWRYRTLEQLSSDALAGIAFLKNRSEINPAKIGLWGISQGGWINAYSAARSTDVAFVVSVAGNGVSPTQQEMFRKDNVYEQLGFSDRARDTALKFWKLIFDWLTLVVENKFPMPKGVLEPELSGAYLGLNYDSVPDWEKITQPVLLTNGEADQLSPRTEGFARIGGALKRAGNLDYTFITFPNASHTITTGKTGLEFDWDTDFAPGYFQTTTDWILSRTNQPDAAQPENQAAENEFSKDFADIGRYGRLPWYGQTYPQFVSLIFFPFIFFSGFISCLFGFFQRRRLQSNAARRLRYLLAAVCLANLFLLSGFYFFLATSVFPQGMSLMQSYSIPVWQRILPLIGVLSLILSILFMLQTIVVRKETSGFKVLMLLGALIFIPWLYYWNLIGFVF